ncbi:unnamed protein product [Blepharisma stoltei]|uniref:Uncharacterized protein n=1 Tax=Blepharisma stoltei TaxID=1481888 RepID=A0AAU9INM7_9CILI|nr:unnamed protein product [Blepharisma stoltei]
MKNSKDKWSLSVLFVAPLLMDQGRDLGIQSSLNIHEDYMSLIHTEPSINSQELHRSHIHLLLWLIQALYLQ